MTAAFRGLAGLGGGSSSSSSSPNREPEDEDEDEYEHLRERSSPAASRPRSGSKAANPWAAAKRGDEAAHVWAAAEGSPAVPPAEPRTRPGMDLGRPALYNGGGKAHGPAFGMPVIKIRIPGPAILLAIVTQSCST